MPELNLQIKDEDFEVLKSRAIAQGFSDVESYLLDLVGQVLLQIKEDIPKVESTDSEDAKHSKNPDSEIDPDQAAKDVLRDLGYI